jgi:hypothetical protein
MRFFIGCALLAVATPAFARSERQVSYPFDKVWPAAVRFLRIDQHMKIVEKDADTGYVLFEVSDGKRTYQGAEELVKSTDADGREAVRCVITIEQRPSWVEEDLLEKFEEKLQTELGPPVPAPPAPAPPPEKPKDEPKDSDE